MAFGFGLRNLGLGEQTPQTAAYIPPVSADDASSNTSNASSGGGSESDQGHHHTLNHASVNAEASLAIGIGANATIHSDVSQSPDQLAKNESEYALAAERGIREGMTPEQVAQTTLASTQLSQARQRELYDEIAQTRGTSGEQIAQQQQAQAAQVQQAMWGGAGAAVSGAGVFGALDGMTGQNQDRPVQQAQSQGQSNPLAGLLAGCGPLNLGSNCRDMGPTTAALASGNVQHGLAVGEERQRGGMAIG